MRDIIIVGLGLFSLISLLVIFILGQSLSKMARQKKILTVERDSWKEIANRQ